MTAGDGDESDRPAEDDSSPEEAAPEEPEDASPSSGVADTETDVQEPGEGDESAETADSDESEDEPADAEGEEETADSESEDESVDSEEEVADSEDKGEAATEEGDEGEETGNDKEAGDDEETENGEAAENGEGEDTTADSGGITAENVTGGSDIPDPDDPDADDVPGLGGAPDDQEMPLTEHIEEMLSRMVAVIVVMGVVSILIFPIADQLINYLWYSFLPGSPAECAGGTEGIACPRVYHPLGLLLARLKVASLAGMILALPVFVYQTYLFMRPGLYPNERRYYLAAVPTSLILAFVGVAFAYFLILPVIFEYFLFYSEDVANIAFGLGETFNLILLMMGLFAFIFQIPLFIMLAIMMGVTTREWLADKRIIFWFSFAGIAFLFSPDPTGMAPFMVAITMVVLFEGTLLLLRWTGR